MMSQPDCTDVRTPIAPYKRTNTKASDPGTKLIDPMLLLPTQSGWIALSTSDFIKGHLEAKRFLASTGMNQTGRGSPDENNRQLSDANRAARLLNVKASWLLQRAREGRIPHYRIGKYIRFDVHEIRSETGMPVDRHANS